MAFVLEGVLLPYLTETIAEHERRCLERMDAIIEHDDFAAMSGEELGKNIISCLIERGVMINADDLY